MKKQINEVRRIQQLAGLLRENESMDNDTMSGGVDWSKVPSADYDFEKGPDQDPLVKKLLDYLKLNYIDKVDFEYDPHGQGGRLYMGSKTDDDVRLIDLLDAAVNASDNLD